MAVGRPSEYSQEVCAAICARLSDGESLRSITRDETMPACATVFVWLAKHPEFVEQYTRAREAQADALFDECLEIADEARNDVIVDGEGRETVNQEVIARSRLRVDTRKWIVGKLAPKKYGDKVTQELTGPNGGPIQSENKVTVYLPANGR